MVNMWMVRAGPGSFLIDDFIKNNVVAIGWNLGDLSNRSDDEIYELYKNKYKNHRSVSQVLRFKNDIEIGDYVISAKGKTRTYFLGRITSDYYYSEKITKTDSSNDNYFDVRDVEWLGEVQRDDLTKPVQKTVGANITVFNIDDYAKEEILKVYRKNMKSIDNAACIIKKYLRENNAEILAEASSVRLGDLIKIEYNWSDFHFYSIADYDCNMDVSKEYSPYMEFTPDSIEISDNVSFVWEIK